MEERTSQSYESEIQQLKYICQDKNKQLQQYKQQIDKLKHKIQLLQMDGQVEVKDLLTLLQILKESDGK